MNAVCVIPARGGSRGVLRKNLRMIGGVPLVARTVAAALAAERVGLVIVSTDDPEISAVAHHAGAVVHHREESGPDETVAEVVAAALAGLYDYGDKDGADLLCNGPVVVCQPSSPFTDAALIDACLATLEDADSLATVTPVRHGAWTKDGPLHSHSVNRQYASPHAWIETGAVQAVRRFPAEGGPVKGAPLVGERHVLFDPAEEMGVGPAQAQRYALDIDTTADFAVAQDLASRGTVTFVVAAGDDTGSGHLHRALTLADELAGHDVSFRFKGECSAWALDAVEARGYPTQTAAPSFTAASVTVFDCLEWVKVTDVLQTQANRGQVAVFECLDQAVCAQADLAVNALYQGPGLAGPGWEPLRPEFSVRPVREERDDVRLLVSFGGTDPSRLTERFAQLCQAVLARHEGRGLLRVLWPPGRDDPPPNWFSPWEGSVSEALAWADVAVTSAGRTVLEAAAMGCPVVSVCAHERETLHAPVPGVAWLGHHASVSDEQVGATLLWLLANPTERLARADRAYAAVDPAGATSRLGQILDRMIRG